MDRAAGAARPGGVGVAAVHRTPEGTSGARGATLTLTLTRTQTIATEARNQRICLADGGAVVGPGPTQFAHDGHRTIASWRGEVVDERS
jgi:hypothetical protein